MKKIRVVTILLAGFLLISSCEFLSAVFGTLPSIESYFPLTNGASWTMQGQFKFYDSTGTAADPEATFIASVRLYVSGTKDIGGITCAVLKVNQFSTRELTADELADMNEILDGFEVYVAHTDEGLSFFGGTFSVIHSYEDWSGITTTSGTEFRGTLTGGVPIIPNTILVTESVDAQGSIEDSYEKIDSSGTITYQRNTSVNVSSITTVETEGASVTTGAGTFTCAVVDNTTEITTTRTYLNYGMTSPDVSSQTISADATMSIAEGIGLVKILVGLDSGDNMTNAYGPKELSLELVSYTGL